MQNLEADEILIQPMKSIDPSLVVKSCTFEGADGISRLDTSLASHMAEDILCFRYEQLAAQSIWAPPQTLGDEFFIQALSEDCDRPKYIWIPHFMSSKPEIQSAQTQHEVLKAIKSFGDLYKISMDERIFMEAIWGTQRSVQAFYPHRNGFECANEGDLINAISNMSDYHFRRAHQRLSEDRNMFKWTYFTHVEAYRKKLSRIMARDALIQSTQSAF